MVQAVIWASVAGVLVAVVLFDLRQMRIPNALVLFLLGLFAALQVAGGLAPDILLRAAVAACVLVAGFAGFVLRVIGGGDVKILAVLALFVPATSLSAVMLVFSATLIVGTACVAVSRRFLAHPGSAWAFLRTGRMPLGLPIGAAGIVSMALLGPCLICAA